MENEIKDYEYIRTGIGKIDKVINANYYMPQYIECEKNLIFKKDIVKHSSNLIDIIEERRLCKWNISNRKRKYIVVDRDKRNR